MRAGAWLAAGLLAAGVAWLVMSAAASGLASVAPEIVLLAVVAPLVEEHLKAMPLAVSTRSTVGPISSRMAAARGIAVGLGFAMGETMLLAFAGFVGGMPWIVVTMNAAVRMVMVVPMHTLAAAISGRAAAVALPGSILAFYRRGLIPAMVVHATYNAVLWLLLLP